MKSTTITHADEKPRPEDIAGGQAIIEGVMMRYGNKIAAAVRKPNKEIAIQERYYIPLTKRYKLLGYAFVRGFVTLLEMMVIGMKCLLFSAELALTENEKKPQKWEMTVSVMISFTAAILFFRRHSRVLFYVVEKCGIQHSATQHTGRIYSPGNFFMLFGFHPVHGRYAACIHVSWGRT